MQTSECEINPNAPPRISAASLGFSTPNARQARRLRLRTRLVGVSWAILSIAIYLAVYWMADLSLEWAVAISGFPLIGEERLYHDETVRWVEPILWSPPLLFAVGVVVALRFRWGVWVGVIGSAVAIFVVAMVSPLWALGGYWHALGTAAIFAGGMLWVLGSGLWVLRMFRALSHAGIPYRWNPNKEPWPCHYRDCETDGRIVQVYSRRVSRLGWSWIIFACILAALTIPAFLILPERFRPTAFDWAIIGVSQATTIAIAIICSILGLAVLRRSGRAILIGVCLAYAFVVVGGVNLAIPYDYPANYTDMACISLCTFVGIGAYLVVMSHVALTSRGKLLRAGLPETIRLTDLAESNPSLPRPSEA